MCFAIKLCKQRLTYIIFNKIYNQTYETNSYSNRISYINFGINIGGADVMYQASDVVGVSAGLSFVQAGCKFKDDKGKNSVVYNRNLRMNYVAMPILIHSYLLPGFSVKAGVEPTLLLGAKSHEVQQSFDVDKEGVMSNFHEDEFTINMKNGMRKFGLSIPIGVSYEYKNVVLGALYHVGVFNIYKEGNSARKSVIEMSVGYKFNL